MNESCIRTPVLEGIIPINYDSLNQRVKLFSVDFATREKAREIFQAYFTIPTDTCFTFKKIILSSPSLIPSTEDCWNLALNSLLDWNSWESDLIKGLCEQIESQLIKKQINLNIGNLLFINTTGAEVNRLGFYTCGPSAITMIRDAAFPAKMSLYMRIYYYAKLVSEKLGLPSASNFLKIEAGLRSTLTHEMFHLWSYQNPQMRHRLFEALSFYVPKNYRLPKEITDDLVPNADGKEFVYFSFKKDNEIIAVAPLLLCDKSKLIYENGAFSKDSDDNPSFFTVKWLKLTVEEGVHVPLLNEFGDCVYLPTNEIPLPDFMRKTYNCHPDEAFAYVFESFVWDYPCPDPAPLVMYDTLKQVFEEIRF